MCALVVYRRVIGDGQTVIMLKNCKKARPERYRSIWVDPADMHAFGHSIYAGMMTSHCACVITSGPTNCVVCTRSLLVLAMPIEHMCSEAGT